MQILGRQTGGMGIPLELGPVDTEQMRKQHAERLIEVIDGVDFFSLPTSLGGEARSGQINTSVKVTDDAREHTVSWAGEGGSPAVADLTNLLQLVENTGADWHVTQQV